MQFTRSLVFCIGYEAEWETYMYMHILVSLSTDILVTTVYLEAYGKTNLLISCLHMHLYCYISCYIL